MSNSTNQSLIQSITVNDTVSTFLDRVKFQYIQSVMKYSPILALIVGFIIQYFPQIRRYIWDYFTKKFNGLYCESIFYGIDEKKELPQNIDFVRYLLNYILNRIDDDNPNKVSEYIEHIHVLGQSDYLFKIKMDDGQIFYIKNKEQTLYIYSKQSVRAVQDFIYQMQNRYSEIPCIRVEQLDDYGYRNYRYNQLYQYLVENIPEFIQYDKDSRQQKIYPTIFKYQDQNIKIYTRIINHVRSTYEKQLQIVLIGDNYQILHKLLKESSQQARKESLIYTYVEKEGWCSQKQKVAKTFKNIYLSQVVRKSLVDDIKQFIKSEQFYVDKGLQYQRGYLFYGQPGTGKTSLIKAISNEYKMDMYILNMNQIISGEQFLTQMEQIKTDDYHIVVFEDIDCASLQERKDDDVTTSVTADGNVACKKEKGLTLDVVLNVLDGVIQSSKRIVIATTNYIERLDAALIRDGRMDRKIELKFCDSDQLKQIYQSFMGEVLDDDKLKNFKQCQKSVAEVVNLALQFKSKPETFLQKVMDM